MAYMYILECSDRTLYVGSTRDLERRLWEHNEGNGSMYTSTRVPVRLLYFEQFDRVEDAYRREKQVQGWSRAKRLALVKGTTEKLPTLSKKPRRMLEPDVSRETRRGGGPAGCNVCARKPVRIALTERVGSRGSGSRISKTPWSGWGLVRYSAAHLLNCFV